MKQGPSEYPACTLHIILATAPQRQERLFDERVRQGFFEAFGGFWLAPTSMIALKLSSKGGQIHLVFVL